MKLLITASVVLLSVANALAQEKAVTVEFLSEASQPTAIKLPLPEYPKAAREAGLGGRVSVGVVVDETGKVSSVTDARGPHPVCQWVTEPNVVALRIAASAAAKKAKFQPFFTQTNGILAYTFTPINDKPQIAGITAAPVVGDSSGLKEMKLGEKADIEKTNAARIVTERKTIPGGVLNGKAISLPKPTYPAAARAIGATGTVSVLVVILEDGSMYSALATSGHPLLRHNSEIAACSSKFSPTLLSGRPVKVTGVITYNYLP